MMRTYPLVVATMGLSSLLTMTTSGCSDDGRPPTSSWSDGQGFNDTGKGGAPSEDGGSDATAPTVDCTGVTQSGELVEELITQEPPAFFGGELVPGTYVLRDMLVYAAGASDATEDDPTPTGPTGNGGRGTLVVTSTQMTFLGARGNLDALPPDEASTITYTVSGSQISGHEACGSSRARTLTFSAVGKQLSIRVDATHREVYLRLTP